jgi:hypothetical protein
MLATLTLGVIQCPVACSQTKVNSNWQADFKKHILNSVCCVPNLQSGYTPRKLSNGEWKSGDESVSVGNLVFGYMDKKRVAAGILGNCTGGSGVFDSLLLYEEQNGVPVEVGSQGFSDRGIVKSLTISNGKVHLVSEESHGEEQGKRKIIDLARKDFDPVACLTYDLPKDMQKDISDLVDVYQTAYDQNEMGAEEKKKASVICLRHYKDRVAFAKALRLSIARVGLVLDYSPLNYDKDGKPTFKMAHHDSKTELIDLSTL